MQHDYSVGVGGCFCILGFHLGRPFSKQVHCLLEVSGDDGQPLLDLTRRWQAACQSSPALRQDIAQRAFHEPLSGIPRVPIPEVWCVCPVHDHICRFVRQGIEPLEND